MLLIKDDGHIGFILDKKKLKTNKKTELSHHKFDTFLHQSSIAVI